MKNIYLLGKIRVIKLIYKHSLPRELQHHNVLNECSCLLATFCTKFHALKEWKRHDKSKAHPFYLSSTSSSHKKHREWVYVWRITALMAGVRHFKHIIYCRCIFDWHIFTLNMLLIMDKCLIQNLQHKKGSVILISSTKLEVWNNNSYNIHNIFHTEAKANLEIISLTHK